MSLRLTKRRLGTQCKSPPCRAQEPSTWCSLLVEQNKFVLFAALSPYRSHHYIIIWPKTNRGVGGGRWVNGFVAENHSNIAEKLFCFLLSPSRDGGGVNNKLAHSGITCGGEHWLEMSKNHGGCIVILRVHCRRRYFAYPTINSRVSNHKGSNFSLYRSTSIQVYYPARYSLLMPFSVLDISVIQSLPSTSSWYYSSALALGLWSAVLGICTTNRRGLVSSYPVKPGR